MKIGIIENGFLHAIDIEDAEQDKYLNQGWKPVDSINDELVNNCPEGYIVVVKPYDAGQRICYNYEQVYDIQRVRREIERRKDELASTDYQVIKCYEASLTGSQMPYDINTLVASRNQLREEINILEGEAKVRIK